MREELFDAEFAAGVNISFSLLRGRGEMRQESSGRREEEMTLDGAEERAQTRTELRMDSSQGGRGDRGA